MPNTSFRIANVLSLLNSKNKIYDYSVQMRLSTQFTKSSI